MVMGNYSKLYFINISKENNFLKLETNMRMLHFHLTYPKIKLQTLKQTQHKKSMTSFKLKKFMSTFDFNFNFNGFIKQFHKNFLKSLCFQFNLAYNKKLPAPIILVFFINISISPFNFKFFLVILFLIYILSFSTIFIPKFHLLLTIVYITILFLFAHLDWW